jgi:hypothetical protein
MTARSAATASKFVLACAAAACGLVIAACTNFYEIPIETPIQPKMDVSAFQRVLVAGFVSGGTDDVDANLETVRLLRSQLRTKSPLRVIEAEVLPLADIAASESSAARDSGGTATNGNAATGPGNGVQPRAAAAERRHRQAERHAETGRDHVQTSLRTRPPRSRARRTWRSSTRFSPTSRIGRSSARNTSRR